jgi:uncharacterized protein YbjQ (UPF0145 family)
MAEILFYSIFVIVTFITGTLIERSHYKSIRIREEFFINIPLISSNYDLDASEKEFETKLVVGSVVLAADYFKIMLGSLRNFFGGQVSAFESLTDRARREATLRLRERARDCDAIMNLRLETARIGTNKIESFAYATAIYYKK